MHLNDMYSCIWKKIFILAMLHSYACKTSKGSNLDRKERIVRNDTSLGRCLHTYKYMNSNMLSRFIDASGRPGSGIFGGNTGWFGSFSGCKKLPNARYCLTMFRGEIEFVENISQVISVQWGVCIPIICTNEDVIEGLDFMLHNISRIPMKPQGDKFQRKVECAEDPDYTTGVILTIVLCGIIIGLCLLATITELLEIFRKTDELSTHENSNQILMANGANEKTSLLTDAANRQPSVNANEKGTISQIINCFSLIRNCKFILNTSVGKDDLSYLHGIRVLSLFWIIFLHCNFLTLNSQLPIDNAIDVSRFFRSAWLMVNTRADFGVDTFFVLSGLLVIYVNLKKKEKNNGKINWIKFYFHRIWRLTPSYMFAILFLTKLRPFFGDGPLWFIARDTSSCSGSWWKNLLYINDFNSNSAENCIGQSWYLANDMQFFFLSPLLIITAYRFGIRVLTFVTSAVILASMITTAIIIGHEDLNAVPYIQSIWLDPKELKHLFVYVKDVHTKPYCRIQPYMVGVLLGYTLFKYVSRKFRLRWYSVLTLWALATGVALALIYAPHSAMEENNRKWSKGENILYGSLKWILWSMSIAWVIFACHYGYAGIIRNILGARFWMPLSRINYSVFILHYDLIQVFYLNIETPIHYTAFTMVVYFLSMLVLAYLCAFIYTVAVELPSTNLEILVLNKRKIK